MGVNRMAKFSYHCGCYKVGSLNGLDNHNRRLYKKHGNVDIDKSKSYKNITFISPEISLYQDCKKKVEEKVIKNGGRVTKVSNWVCESIFSYPEELPLERIRDYFQIIVDYMAERLGRENIVEAVVHLDEGSCLPHMHLDSVLITKDGRLSSRDLINRDFIQSVHNELPIILKDKGFDIERGSFNPDKPRDRRTTKQYKKDMAKELIELNILIDELAEEYNSLAENYNSLLRKRNALQKQMQREICR